MKLKDLYENLQLKKSDDVKNQTSSYANIIIKNEQYSLLKVNMVFNFKKLSSGFNYTQTQINKFNNYQTSRQMTDNVIELIEDCMPYFDDHQKTLSTSILKQLNTNYGGFSDWYIPSKYDINILKQAKIKNDIFGIKSISYDKGMKFNAYRVFAGIEDDDLPDIFKINYLMRKV